MMISGQFNDDGGRPSGYMTKLHEAIESLGFHMPLYNGGFWYELGSIIEKAIDSDIILWFPDIPNTKKKLVQDIKKQNPKAMLVTSKNNDNDKYDFLFLTAHALKNKSNLLVELKRSDKGILASVYDPLGNAFCQDEADIEVVARTIVTRLRKLVSFTRVSSEQVGDAVNKDDIGIDYFLHIINENASKFHDLIHGVNHSRLMGNCSFRCTLGGFPSFKRHDHIYVSRRNIDKRGIDRNGFVAVEPITLWDYLNGDFKVRYYGEHKPSVDTPIQLGLYALYPKINYIIHSHTYIEGAPITNNPIPCGAIEEIVEIVEAVPSNRDRSWQVNIKGHGSIAAGMDTSDISEIKWVAREIPETIGGDCNE